MGYSSSAAPALAPSPGSERRGPRGLGWMGTSPVQALRTPELEASPPAPPHSAGEETGAQRGEMNCPSSPCKIQEAAARSRKDSLALPQPRQGFPQPRPQPCPSCPTLKSDRSLLPGGAVTGKSLWAWSQAPGLGIPASCLGRAAFWTARGPPTEGRPAAPSSPPRPIPPSNRPPSSCTERPPVSGSVMLPSRGPGEYHFLGFSGKIQRCWGTELW